MSQSRPKSLPPPLALIVENDGDTRTMYTEMLIFSGWRVAQAATADEGMELARSLHPDIITTDIGLEQGGKDGCDLCAELKRDPRTRAIPVVAVTAWAMGGHVERAWRAGCDSVLVKPVLPEALLAEFARLLKVFDGATT